MHGVLAPVVACCRCSVPAAAAAALLRLLQLAYRLLASAVRLVLAPRGGRSIPLRCNAHTSVKRCMCPQGQTRHACPDAPLYLACSWRVCNGCLLALDGDDSILPHVQGVPGSRTQQGFSWTHVPVSAGLCSCMRQSLNPNPVTLGWRAGSPQAPPSALFQRLTDFGAQSHHVLHGPPEQPARCPSACCDAVRTQSSLTALQ